MNVTPSIATIISALISGIVALVVSVFQNSKSMALVEYKIEELKKAVEKEVSLDREVGTIKRDLKTCFSKYDELKKEMQDLEQDIKALQRTVK